MTRVRNKIGIPRPPSPQPRPKPISIPTLVAQKEVPPTTTVVETTITAGTVVGSTECTM